MTTSDEIALTALVISFGAAIAAFITLWRSHLSRFQPITVVGQLCHRISRMESEHDKWLISTFDAPITVSNNGAKAGQVLGLRLRLSYPYLPIPGNYELLHAKCELSPSDAKRIGYNRNWIKDISWTDWLPFTVTPGSSITKHFIFETRWDEPVAQKHALAELELLSSLDRVWHVVSTFDLHLDERLWPELLFGSSFTMNPRGSVELENTINPPDLHTYTRIKTKIPLDCVAGWSRLVEPDIENPTKKSDRSDAASISTYVPQVEQSNQECKMNEDQMSFDLWYVQPLKSLQNMPNGRGGFVALATACLLYERYAIADLKNQQKKTDRHAILNNIMIDFSVDYETAKAFWDVIRDGLLHQAMPMQQKRNATLPSWGFHHDYPVMSLEEINGEQFLKVQPWKFMDRVLELWEDNFNLLSSNGSFPWATIGPVPA